MTALLAAFPGLQFTVDEQLSAGDGGDVVVTRFTARGTHRGDLLGIAPTGKSVTFQGIIVDRLRDGKIVDSWHYHRIRRNCVVNLAGYMHRDTHRTDVCARG
jgi:predicted ester cyclase